MPEKSSSALETLRAHRLHSREEARIEESEDADVAVDAEYRELVEEAKEMEKQAREEVKQGIANTDVDTNLKQILLILDKTEKFKAFMMKKYDENLKKQAERAEQLRQKREAQMTAKAKEKEEAEEQENKDAISRRATRRAAAAQSLETPPAAKRRAPQTKPKEQNRKVLGEINDDLKEPVVEIKPTGNLEHITEKPALLTGGDLRDYQMRGLQWMNTLYLSALNGILADEMGLGKTIQAIAMICHMYEVGKVDSPVLVVGPLSTLGNWHREFKKFAPLLPTVLYHGSEPERVKLRAKFRRYTPIKIGERVMRSAPVIICSYETILRDINYLRQYVYWYFVLDEGHRIKNYQTALHKALSSLRIKNRLLLTGTPLQNNLSELWSLLNFLMPNVFSSLEWFLGFFDFNEIVGDNATKEAKDAKKLRDSGTEEDRKAINKSRSKAIVDRELQKQMVSRLHEILSAFMLRRRKTDVELNLPPKREIVVYAPMTARQKQLYSAAVHKTLSVLVGDKNLPPEAMIVEGKRKRNDVDYSIYDSNKLDKAWIAHEKAEMDKMIKLERKTDKKNADVPDETRESGDETTASARKKRSSRRTRNVDAQPSTKDNETSKSSSNKKESRDEKSLHVLVDRESSGENSNLSSSAPSSSNATPQPSPCGSDSITRTLWRKTGLSSMMTALRELTMHPFLVNCPIDEKGYIVVSEDLVTASGKMRLLDQLLKALKERGHKVLLFSQYVMLLDLVDAYCELRDFKYCRLDGGMNFEAREESIEMFNDDPEVFIMLVSTRAGGLGLNLTAADTVIIFDSDWNPQADLQAQDRCHRIGQTRPVIVYRLVARGTIDERIVMRAQNKRRLEKLIIRDGRFMEGSMANSSSSKPKVAELEEELAALLEQDDFDAHMESGDADDDDGKPPLSQAQLEALLDRSDLLTPAQRAAAGIVEVKEIKEKVTEGAEVKPGGAMFEIVDGGTVDTAVPIA